MTVRQSLSSPLCGQFDERVKDVGAKPSVLNSMWVTPHRLDILEQPTEKWGDLLSTRRRGTLMSPAVGTQEHVNLLSDKRSFIINPRRGAIDDSCSPPLTHIFAKEIIILGQTLFFHL